ncbi:metallophosphoesterase [Sphingomonas sp. AP4-R1]|uniref:metallophosphoesterase family protein n=1 Tax=Sphingomonas sp. AP4-R1 TaxID=2735134 RepID=UPI0014933E33|nr:metallophosphoesterase [Sphingomonas sp. AP4-R1]QJU59871.1 metallophosphoesterase [Sphingomonas sp. AP4-R1]
MQIALISDTHLTPVAPAFDANLAAARRWIAERGIGLTVHLGDITADGAVDPAQVDHARAMLTDWPGDLRVLPGNHDIGDNPGPHDHPPVTRERLDRHAAAFGPDRWAMAAAGWTLIGLDAQLFGQGADEERAQDAWLEGIVAKASGPIGLFLHKPLFRDGTADRSLHHRYVPPDAGVALLRRLGEGLRFVVSGHTHQTRQLHIGGIEHLWVPSTAFILPDAMQDTVGVKDVGMAVVTLEQGAHRFELVQPEGMVRHDLADHADVYPDYADQLRAMAGRRHD